MKKILMLATYTIANPQHGGQKRVRAIYESYKNHTNIVPKFCAIYFPPHYKESWPDDIALPRQVSAQIAKHPLTNDVITGRLIKDNAKLRRKVQNLILDFNPDIIEIEHPFLYIGLADILDYIKFKGKIIYSSHNIEFSMKQEMLENEHVDANEVESLTNEIKLAELALAKKANLVFAVSEGDIATLHKLGIEKAKIVLARNGIQREEAKREDIEYWDNYFNNIGVKKIALFVGSAHPPNWTGFQAMVGSKIGMLKKNERIVLAGSIGEYFRDHYKHSSVDGVVFWKRIMATGRLTEERLAALLQRADCLILPIIEGGGSNLKTAEALLSEKPVVGTSHALRAFEDFVGYPTVNMTDKPVEFRKLVAKCIRGTKPTLTNKQHSNLQLVTWEACLGNAIKEVDSL